MEHLLNPLSSSDDSISGSAGNSESTFDGDFDFGFGDVDEEVFRTEKPQVPEGGTDIGNRTSIAGSRIGRTNRWIGGSKYTRANNSQNKISYRCSPYSSKCGGKCDFVMHLQRYTNFVPHTCGQRAGEDGEINLTPSITEGVTWPMKREVGRMAIP
ncbi:hypothetical protein ON010_g644 [Phytophthora cinnamomi]|nr:hypothetical protein ON010_g644 [Phytophthora cinnamomi]